MLLFLIELRELITAEKIKRALVIIKEHGFLFFVQKVLRALKLLNAYNDWLKEHAKRDLSFQKAEIFQYSPKISIITATFNTNPKLLRAAITSVSNQTYPNWELCIADGKSNDEVKNVLEEYAKKDSRIKIVFLDKNKGIAGNMNEALNIASGEFTGFLDHDDELHPSALYEIVKLLNTNRELDFIYTDEDKISIKGKRFSPHFKTDWSPDLLRSSNYICHFAVIRKTIIDSIGGFSPEYEGSQDYDIFLRISEITDRIAHIPKVLYHWRVHKTSVAGNAKTKMYAYDSAKKALSSHLQRLGLEGTVDFTNSLGYYRIKYAINTYPPVSIIIPNKDNPGMLKKCINSVLNKSTYQNYKIVIVENQSVEKEVFDYYKELKKISKIKIINYNKTFNFSSINNYAVSQTDTEYLIFLNNDTEVISPEWIESMLEFAQRKDVGAIGAKLYYKNNRIQHGGIIIWQNGILAHAFKNVHKKNIGDMARAAIIQNYSAVTAACMMTKKSIFDKVGGFDDSFAFSYNDVDYCLKIRELGYLIVWTPYAELYHYESKSRGYDTTEAKKDRHNKEWMLLRTKWKSIFENGDPYYNPNLSIQKEDFSLNIK